MKTREEITVQLCEVIFLKIDINAEGYCFVIEVGNMYFQLFIYLDEIFLKYRKIGLVFSTLEGT